ncbi:MAG: DEAD/DEAH box helicase [Planctomycetaceae bacterium]|jgi:ATP-dependent RNA helicase DeaD|nr:DEAD/DEAH box helicase [Planctomycetaceae bacterium]
MGITKNNKNNANNRNNKSARNSHAKRQDRHADLVDSFQWGFVEGADNEVADTPDTTNDQNDTQKKNRMKTSAKVASNSSVAYGQTNNPIPKITIPKPDKNTTTNHPKKKKKKNRQLANPPIKNVTNIIDNTSTNPIPASGDSGKVAIPSFTVVTKIPTNKNQNAQNPTPKETTKNTRRKITTTRNTNRNITKPKESDANLLFKSFDEENDLNLPSYGRTFRVDGQEVDQKTKQVDTQVNATEKRPQPNYRQQHATGIKSPLPAPSSNLRNVKSDVGNLGSDKSIKRETTPEISKPKKEQMVWDPDKREYVPLQTSDQFLPKPLPVPSTQPPVKPQHQPITPKQQLPKPDRNTNKITTQPNTTKNNQTPINKKSAVGVGASVGGTTANLVKGADRLHSNVQQRGDVPRPVTSKRPDPADIESDVRGFSRLGLSDVMLEALRILRYIEPTPIQAGVFELVKAGKDLMGQAQTGTGKTAAFSIPIIEGIEECPPGDVPVALILVPTRELAVQVRDEIVRLSYGRDIRIAACYGGKPIVKQIAKLNSGIDIVVGTPGRVLDLMNRRTLVTDMLKWIVLDEADRMLDIGFRPDIEKILKKSPPTRQTLLFSATLPQPVVKLAERYMREPEILDFSNKQVSVDTIEQFYVTVDNERKFDALVYLLNEERPNQAIIFTRTKRGADRLARLLSKQMPSLSAIHGDLPQTERDKIMSKFRAGELRYLVATDVVGRGIDVSGISHIINYDIPHFCDDYVHRVGRTGRMGREGVAYTFVTAEEGNELTRIEMRIEKLLKRAGLKGFESFSKPVQENNDNDNQNHKPVFGKHVRKVRRAL